MLKIILYGLFAHLLFLASIFHIYFQSPIVGGLQSQANLDNPPADRLVLFVADGLRAESFYRDDLVRTPFLREQILRHGMHGVSHTHVPSESRPGHVALIAGFYEDPSAVLKGWQDNPVDFDTIFNRSDTTYAWGSPDIISVFTKRQASSRIIANAYTAEREDFTGKTRTSSLDTWVFDKTIEFLHRNRHQLVAKKRIIFFLHLLGLDTAGHVHKPNSELFDENLRIVDAGVKNVTKLFNEIFNDQRTAFVFTSDHGMSNKGAHGAGTAHETETPIVVWGAGINHWSKVDKTSEVTTSIGGDDVPRFDIQQADVAPLISTLLGNAVPVNNVGQLPHLYLNVSQEYKCKSALANAMQIADQFKHLQNQFRSGLFFKDYVNLNGKNLLSLEYEIQSAIKSQSYTRAIDLSNHYMELALDGIKHFQTYYQSVLLLAVSVSMIGWMFFLYQQLDIDEQKKSQITRKTFLVAVAIAVAISAFIYLQKVPLASGIFLLLPVICWTPVRTFNMLRQMGRVQTWCWLAGVELLVLSFFHRFFLTGLLVALLSYEYVILKEKKEKLKAFFNWALNCAVLAVFPLLPLVDKDSNNFSLLFISLAAWNMKLISTISQGKTTFRLANAIVFAIGSLNYVWIVYDLNAREGLSEIKQLISWSALIVSFVLPTISPNSFRDRLMAIMSSLALPFSLMSLSYEPLFLMIFTSNIYYWVSMIYTDKKQLYAQQLEETDKIRSIQDVDFKRALISILYILVSFFGTGNIASVSSFDPNWVRCFVGAFSPFLMASLIIVKLLIPVLIVMCAVQLIHAITKIPLDKFFIIILLCCDIMCLNFLFLVRNTGSWLEIGTSISHFVIMEVTVVVLCLLQLIAKLLTTGRLQSLFSNRSRDLSHNTPKIE